MRERDNKREKEQIKRVGLEKEKVKRERMGERRIRMRERVCVREETF